MGGLLFLCHCEDLRDEAITGWGGLHQRGDWILDFTGMDIADVHIDCSR
jgi:hypothetical protein